MVAINSAEKKRRQRARWKAEGWIQITVRIPAERRADFDAFVAALGAPSPKALPGQQPLFPELGEASKGDKSTLEKR